MKIVRLSPISKTRNEMELPITEEQYKSWVNGKLIQNAMPHLSADEREFVLTGITPEEWADVFGEEYDEDKGE